MLDAFFHPVSRSVAARRVMTPLLRSYIRYFPVASGKERLWLRVVDKYLAWHSYEFVARTSFGQRVEGNTRDMIQQYLYYFGEWEPDLTAWIRTRLAPGDVFVDVGANIGYYALLGAATVGPSGGVVAIEASPTIFRQLQSNLARNRAQNVRAVNVAAADRRGTLQLFRGPDHNVGQSTLIAGGGYEPDVMVEAAPLTEILTPPELAGTRLIKIDVEGAEWAVLQGLGATTLTGCRANLELIVELHPQYLAQQGRRAEEVVDLLGQAGFHAYRLESSYWPFTFGVRTLKPSPRLRPPIETETVAVFSRQKGDYLE